MSVKGIILREYSYILFECMTANGYMVLGVRGTSALGNGDYERFIYEGSFRKDHYFKDGVEVRRGSDLKALLVEKGFKVLTPRNLQALLTGSDIGSGITLNLLPIKNEDGYKKFRQTYKNLLELATVGQEQVKDALIQMCQPEMRVKGVVDLQERFKKKQEEIKKIRMEIETVRKLKPHIEECFTLNTQMNEARANMAVGYMMILDGFRQYQKENIETIEKLEEEQEQRAEDLSNRIEDKKTVYSTICQLSEQKGTSINKRDVLKNEKIYFNNYIPDFEAAEISALQVKEEAMAADLARITIEDINVIEPRLKQNIEKAKTLQRRLSNFEKTFAKLLCKEFTKEQISRVFSVFNAQILGQSTDDGTVEVQDVNKLVANIQAVLDRINDDVYSDSSISLNLIDELRPSLSEYFNMDEVQQRIALIEAEISRDEKTLETAKRQSDLKSEYMKTKKDLSSARQEAERYKKFKESEANIEVYGKEIKKLEGQIEAKDNEFRSLEKECDTLMRMIASLKKGVEKIRSEEAEIKRDIEGLQRPEPDWHVPEKHGMLDDEFKIMIESHKQYAGEQVKWSDQLQRNLAMIESQLGPGGRRYDSDQHYMESLQEKLDELENRENAANSLWEKTLISLHTDLRDLLEDVKIVRDQAKSINRDLSKIQISDLIGLKIIVKEKRYITELFQRIVNKAAASQHKLFEIADANGLSNSKGPLKELERIAVERGRIELRDLFSLEFEVIKIDGKKEAYTSLTNVESNGTNITIKVIVNLMLMRGLFDDKKNQARIPFYLDEVAALDDRNRKAVIKKAVELGFTPIIASPDAHNIVNKIYNLQSGRKQGLYVDSRNMTLLEEVAA